MARFLLVDDRDGRVLAELASPGQAARLLARQARNPDGGFPVSVVRLDHQQSSLSEVDSIVTIRLLPALTPRRARSRRSPDRPSPPPRPLGA